MQLVVNRGRAKGKSVTGPCFRIGRDPECQLRPASEEVSRLHAELEVFAGVATIVDLGSERGTLVNGRKLAGPASLRTGDLIEIGPLCFTALVDDPAPSAPVKPKRTREDVIVSWLTVEDDEAPHSPDPALSRPAAQTPAKPPARRPSGEDEFDLLRSRTSQPS